MMRSRVTKRSRHHSRRKLRATVGTVLLATSVAAFVAPVASAVEVGPTGNPIVIQTNGPNNPVDNGDFYSATGTPHFMEIDVPCTWPATWPLVVDLFSPEIQTASVNDEIVLTSDDVRFLLKGPSGAVVADTTFAPNDELPDYERLVTILPAPCGVYYLEMSVSDDDQAGYKVRVGTDDDGDPNSTPPAGYDDVDGVPSTGDEITVGLTDISLQQDSGGDVCLPFYEYVAPGLPSVRFHNFDFDNAGTVAYYPPSTGVNFSAASLAGQTSLPAVPGMINGTASGFDEWNSGSGSGTNAVRGGDVIATPEDGWWALVVCITNNNQFIFEAQEGVPIYFEKPAIPLVSLSKDDKQTEVYVGQQYAYDIAYENSDQTPTPMDIEDVKLIDTLPAGLTFVGCTMSDPALTCAYDATTHEVNSSVGFMAAGDSGVLTVTALVDSAATSPVTNDVTLTYMSIGTNVFRLEASDTDTVVDPPAPTDPQLTITKDDGQTLLAQGGTTTYGIDVANTSADAAESVTVVDPAVPGLTFTACRVVTGPTGSSCSIDASGNMSANLGTMAAPSTARIEVDATVGALVAGAVTNTATVNWSNDDGDPRTATDEDADTVPAPPTDPQLTITKDDGQTLLAQSGTTTYVIDVTNTSADAAQSVTITDPAVAGLTFTACRVVTGPTGSSCSIDAFGGVSATLGTMPTPSTARIEVDATVGPLVTGTLTNVATVNWSNDAGHTRTATDDDADQVPPPILPRTGTDTAGRFLSLAALLMIGGYSARRASTGPMSRLPR